MSILDGVEKITSVSREGSSSIRLEYAWGTDLNDATFKAREKIDIARSYFPENVGRTKIFK